MKKQEAETAELPWGSPAPVLLKTILETCLSKMGTVSPDTQTHTYTQTHACTHTETHKHTHMYTLTHRHTEDRQTNRPTQIHTHRDT